MDVRGIKKRWGVKGVVGGGLKGHRVLGKTPHYREDSPEPQHSVRTELLVEQILILTELNRNKCRSCF